MPVIPRDDGSGLSHQTIIIIAVCASVGGLIVFAVGIRFIRLSLARSPSRSAPLPPVQPLARHREQQLAKFYASSRPTTAYEPSNLAVPHFVSSNPSLRGSKTSLLGGTGSPSTASHDGSTLGGYDTAEALSLASPMAVNAMELPSPNFHVSASGSASSTSLSSSDHGVVESPMSITSVSSLSQTSCGDTHPSTRSSSQPRTPSSHSRKARRASLASTSTSYSKSSRRSGAPHAPYNNIQIILPAPLAPGIQPSYPRRPIYTDSDGSSRLSVADVWTPKTYRSEGPSGMEMASRSNSRSSDTRHSISSQSSSRSHSHSHSTHGRQPRRINSTLSSEISHDSPSASPPVTPNSAGYESAPPVPRIPSKFNNTVVDSNHHERHAMPTNYSVTRGRPPVAPFASASRSSSLPPTRADAGGFLRQ